jgi:hypothetical protein
MWRGGRWRSRRPGRCCFLRCSRQRLARAGKNLAGPRSRGSRTRRNRNAARRDGRRNRTFRRVSGLSRRKRRTQGRGSGNRRSRGRLHRDFTGCRLRSLHYGFRFRSRRSARWFRGNLGFVFHRRFVFRRFGSPRLGGSVRFLSQPALDLDGDRFIDRTGVGFLFRDAQLGEHIEDHVRFHLELARQLVNSNFHHTVCPAVQFRHRGYQTIPCSLFKASAPAGGSAMSIVTDCPGASSASAALVSATDSAGAASPSAADSN